ncbi:molybdate ABC transporter ATP-binding protein ModF, partial [Klebsiella pneumoniae]
MSDEKSIKKTHRRGAGGESWAFVGSNGGGKTALARARPGDLPLLGGQRKGHFPRVTRLS